ncbi:MAG TPA: dihydrofolate reductase family protein [Terriglobales bacterium]|nr:dihydrofolate reductase family protein [Terriglobales bacterium]
MRRLKLQMHISIDGMVALPAQSGRGNFNWDAELRQYSISNAANVDCILLGRKTAASFIPHWKAVADNPKDADFEIGKVITDLPKVVFSKTIQKSEWPNATVANGEIADSVNQLKSQTGKDMLVYGGSGFVASLIENNLIDEYYLLVNPVALGSGLTIFSGLTGPLRLTLVNHKVFSCGTVLLRYEPGGV